MHNSKRANRRDLGQLLLAILALGFLASACRGESDEPTPTWPPDASSPTSADTQNGASEVNLGTGSALVWGSGNYGVVLVHGAIYDAASWTTQAEAIADAGFSVVAIEHATVDDTRAAMDHLRRTFGVEKVALIGASAGTGPVLSVASGQKPESSPAVDLVVILAGSGNVDELNVPSVLFIAAEGDGGAAAAAERMMNETSGNRDDLLIVSGSAHAQALFNEPEGDQVLDAIIGRLTERQNLLTTEP